MAAPIIQQMKAHSLLTHLTPIVRVAGILLFIFTSKVTFAQKKNIFKEVLERNQVNMICTFDSSSKQDGYYVIKVVYLGVMNGTNAKYKILTRRLTWGPNRHTSGKIFIYDMKNKYIGKYELGSAFDLPERVEKDSLIFTNRLKEECDSKLTTKISFRQGLPKEIFIKCEGNRGDFYTFSNSR